MSFWCKNQYDVIIDLMNLSFPALKELCTNKTFSWHTISNHWKSNLDTYYHFHIIRKRGSKSIILFLGDYRHYVYGIIKKNKKPEICLLFSSYFIQNGNLIIILFIALTKDLRPIHPINQNYRYGALLEEFKSGIAYICLQLSFTRSGP